MTKAKKQPLWEIVGDINYVIYSMESMKDTLEGDHFNAIRMYKNLKHNIEKLTPTLEFMKKHAKDIEGEEDL